MRVKELLITQGMSRRKGDTVADKAHVPECLQVHLNWNSFYMH